MSVDLGRRRLDRSRVRVQSAREVRLHGVEHRDRLVDRQIAEERAHVQVPKRGEHVAVEHELSGRG